MNVMSSEVRSIKKSLIVAGSHDFFKWVNRGSTVDPSISPLIPGAEFEDITPNILLQR